MKPDDYTGPDPVIESSPPIAKQNRTNSPKPYKAIPESGPSQEQIESDIASTLSWYKHLNCRDYSELDFILKPNMAVYVAQNLIEPLRKNPFVAIQECWSSPDCPMPPKNLDYSEKYPEDGELGPVFTCSRTEIES